MIVVSDSTILIGLAKIGKLDLLSKIFPKIFIPQEVYIELVEKGKRKPRAGKIKKRSVDRIQVRQRPYTGQPAFGFFGKR